MRKIALAIIMLITSTLCMAQAEEGFSEVSEFGADDSKNIPEEINDYLGFMLLPGSSNLMRFYEIHVTYDHKLKYRELTMDSFVYRAMGKERSDANPKGKNLFEEYGIKDPNIVCHLWKLRYKEYPYRTIGKPEEGWSNNEKYDEIPSPQQFDILGKYGIHRVQDLCYGEQAFALLKDMSDPGWVSRYCGRGMGGDTPTSTGDSNEDYEPYVEDR